MVEFYRGRLFHTVFTNGAGYMIPRDGYTPNQMADAKGFYCLFSVIDGENCEQIRVVLGPNFPRRVPQDPPREALGLSYVICAKMRFWGGADLSGRVL